MHICFSCGISMGVVFHHDPCGLQWGKKLEGRGGEKNITKKTSYQKPSCLYSQSLSNPRHWAPEQLKSPPGQVRPMCIHLPHCVQPPALCQGNAWQGELASHSTVLYHNQRHQMWVHSLWPYTIKMKYIWCLIYFCTVSYAEIQLRVQKDTQFMLVGIQHSPASCHLPQVSPLHPWGRARGGACDPFSVPQQFDVSSSFPTLSATQHWGLIQRKQKLSVISAGQIDGRFTLVVTTELDAYVHCYSLLLCLGL